MQTVRTFNKALWKDGDKGFITPLFDSNPEYGFTKHKEYVADITEAKYSYRFSIINDYGDKSVITVDDNTDRDGYYSCGIEIPRTEYNARANDLNAAKVKALHDRFQEDLNKLRKEHDEIWKVGNDKPWDNNCVSISF